MQQDFVWKYGEEVFFVTDTTKRGGGFSLKVCREGLFYYYFGTDKDKIDLSNIQKCIFFLPKKNKKGSIMFIDKSDETMSAPNSEGLPVMGQMTDLQKNNANMICKVMQDNGIELEVW